MTTAEEARSVIAQQIAELNEIVAASRGGKTQAGFERLRRWKARTVDLLNEKVHPTEGNRLAAKQKASSRMGDPFGNLRDEARMYTGFLDALDSELQKHPEGVLRPAQPTPVEHLETEASIRRRGSFVFIVHGHDELNLLRVKELLRERWKLDTIVLSGEAGRGRTIIEKFEEEAQRASFAFVLITPDDLIRTADGAYAQARPNVLFELGWFYGRLGRERVCILAKAGATIHSDLAGISRIVYEQSVSEKAEEIERELLTAGILKN